MHKPIQKIAMISTLIAGLAGTSVVYGEDSQRSPGSKMERGAPGQGGPMMGQRGGMGCMMGGGEDSDRPNDQWRKHAPSNPGERS